MKICAREDSEYHGMILGWSTAIVTCVLILACLVPAVFAVSTEADNTEVPQVFTNDDLPGLVSPPAAKSEDTVPSLLRSALPTLDQPELAGIVPHAFPLWTSNERLTVPELLIDLDHLQRRKMRLLVPFLPRRFAEALPSEREAEQGLDNRARAAQLQAELHGVLTQLLEAGVDAPSRGFGQPAPLIVSDLGESPRPISSLTVGPAIRQDPVARTAGGAQFQERTFRQLEETTAFVSSEEFNDSRPTPIFAELGEDRSVILPHDAPLQEKTLSTGR